ncbi:unnamed protein product [Pleuronectes platessa]|uniref:Uncharacterized protein n=1 Tax=Pleuronectes platessa TaxID=8262 RepID=A0A9N7TJG4_PLEPL|nr:unnamed protein product [Pleuronectes platessa]
MWRRRNDFIQDETDSRNMRDTVSACRETELHPRWRPGAFPAAEACRLMSGDDSLCWKSDTKTLKDRR